MLLYYYLNVSMLLYDKVYILPFTLFIMNREAISLKINPELWKEAKKKCIDKSISYSEYVEGLITKDLGKK